MSITCCPVSITCCPVSITVALCPSLLPCVHHLLPCVHHLLACVHHLLACVYLLPCVHHLLPCVHHLLACSSRHRCPGGCSHLLWFSVLPDTSTLRGSSMADYLLPITLCGSLLITAIICWEWSSCQNRGLTSPYLSN